MGIDEILCEVEKFNVGSVTVTGGEPLAQKDTLSLLRRLCDKNFEVSLETSGAIDLGGVDRRVVKVVDVKTPGSKEVERNLWSNMEHLHSHDQIKFVICDRTDYEWGREKAELIAAASSVEILFSPSHEQLEPRLLAEWILEDTLEVRFQIQLHKYLWGDERGR